MSDMKAEGARPVIDQDCGYKECTREWTWGVLTRINHHPPCPKANPPGNAPEKAEEPPDNIPYFFGEPSATGAVSQEVGSGRLEWPECLEFYDLMQKYRHWPIDDQEGVVAAYEDVIRFVRAKPSSVPAPDRGGEFPFPLCKCGHIRGRHTRTTAESPLNCRVTGCECFDYDPAAPVSASSRADETGRDWWECDLEAIRRSEWPVTIILWPRRATAQREGDSHGKSE